MSKTLIATVMVASSVALFAATPSVNARPYDGKQLGTVTACSTYGNQGCVTAKVRKTRLGLQYRSKGGNWIWCEHDCRDTIRRHTVDFWNDQQERAR